MPMSTAKYNDLNDLCVTDALLQHLHQKYFDLPYCERVVEIDWRIHTKKKRLICRINYFFANCWRFPLRNRVTCFEFELFFVMKSHEGKCLSWKLFLPAFY